MVDDILSSVYEEINLEKKDEELGIGTGEYSINCRLGNLKKFASAIPNNGKTCYCFYYINYYNLKYINFHFIFY